jgi:hypothetical protein
MTLTDAYFSGAWHGALGTLFVVAGLLGWPRVRFILSLIFCRQPRHPVGKPFSPFAKPCGSPGTQQAAHWPHVPHTKAIPFWEQYK